TASNRKRKGRVWPKIRGLSSIRWPWAIPPPLVRTSSMKRPCALSPRQPVGSIFAADRSSLEGIYGTLDQVETRQMETISHRPRRDLFHWPLGFATVVSLIYPLASSVLGALRGWRIGTTAQQETAV